MAARSKWRVDDSLGHVRAVIHQREAADSFRLEGPLNARSCLERCVNEPNRRVRPRPDALKWKN